MLAGIMRFKENPPKNFFRLLTITTKAEGVDLIYLTPDSINIKTGKVKGKMLINDQLVIVERELPGFIDISPHFFNKQNKNKFGDILTFLIKNTELSNDTSKVIRKDKLQQMLIKSVEFSKLAIPTLKPSCFDDLINFINEYNKIVIKPVGGLQGKGVMLLEKKGGNFKLSEKDMEKVVTFNELREYFAKTIQSKSYIMQKYISSKSKTGEPVDCRVHLEKNGKNKWEIARAFVRIGIGQKIVSNINQGGCISDLQSYLDNTFKEYGKEIYKSIENIANKLPYEIEKYKKKEFMVMGFDVGIGSNGDLCLFEVNGFPIVSPQRDRIVRLRGAYYAFRVKRKINKKAENLMKEKLTKSTKKEIIEQKNKLEIKIKKLEKRIKKIENSTSWKITKPLRKLGRISK